MNCCNKSRSDMNHAPPEKIVTIRGKQLLVVGEYMYLLNKVAKSYPDQDLDNGNVGPPVCVETSYWTCRHRNCHARAITSRVNDSEEIKTVNKGPNHTCNTSPVDVIHYKARQDIIRIYSEGKDSLSEVYNRIVGDMQIHHPAAVDGFYTMANINSACSRARRKRKLSDMGAIYDKDNDHIQMAIAAHSEHVAAIPSGNGSGNATHQLEYVNGNQGNRAYTAGVETPSESTLSSHVSLNPLPSVNAMSMPDNHVTYLNAPMIVGVYDTRPGNCELENYVDNDTETI